MSLHRGYRGEYVVRHHYANGYSPQDHTFGENEPEEAINHVAENWGMTGEQEESGEEQPEYQQEERQ